MNNKGNVLIISMFFFTGVLTIFLFVIAVFVSHINSILCNIKLDMYSLNKSAVIAVNKNKANMDEFEYSVSAYKNEFIRLLKKNYNLDDNLSNDEKLITSFKIEEYEIYDKKQRDSYTNSKCKNRVIHSVMKVKIKPIILKSFFENIFEFEIHEDVNLNMMNEYI